jgi:hypothetical protein
LDESSRSPPLACLSFLLFILSIRLPLRPLFRVPSPPRQTPSSKALHLLRWDDVGSLDVMKQSIGDTGRYGARELIVDALDMPCGVRFSRLLLLSSRSVLLTNGIHLTVLRLAPFPTLDLHLGLRRQMRNPPVFSPVSTKQQIAESHAIPIAIGSSFSPPGSPPNPSTVINANPTSTTITIAITVTRSRTAIVVTDPSPTPPPSEPHCAALPHTHRLSHSRTLSHAHLYGPSRKREPPPTEHESGS